MMSSQMNKEDDAKQSTAKNSGRWTSEEHTLFLDGLNDYGEDWKKIAELVQTRTVVQVRTHAQKFMKKLAKAEERGDLDPDPATLMATTDASGKARPPSVASLQRGGAADTTTLAWEAAMSRAEALKMEADVTIQNTRGRKCPRNVDGDHAGLKRTRADICNRISPTFVSDINYIPFLQKQEGRSAAKINHLPPRIVPCWCVKPNDGAVGSHDPGPFRWFVNEPSNPQPGPFFQPTARTWSGGDTTSASSSVVSSNVGEAEGGGSVPETCVPANTESPSTPFVFNDDFNDVSPSNPRWNAPLPSLDDEELMGFLA